MKLICGSIDLGWGVWEVAQVGKAGHFFELFFLEDCAEAQVGLFSNLLLEFKLLEGWDFRFSGLYWTWVFFKVGIVMGHFERRLGSLWNGVLFGRVFGSECMNLVFCLLFFLSWPFLVQIKLESRLSSVRLLILGLMGPSVVCPCSVLSVGLLRVWLIDLLVLDLLGLWNAVLVQNFCLILRYFLLLVAVDLLWASWGSLLVLVRFFKLFLQTVSHELQKLLQFISFCRVQVFVSKFKLIVRESLFKIWCVILSSVRFKFLVKLLLILIHLVLVFL